MFQVYILESITRKRYYIGHTNDIRRRLAEHNFGKKNLRKHMQPGRIVYLEDIETKHETYKREMQIKSYKGGRAFKELVGNIYGGVA